MVIDENIEMVLLTYTGDTAIGRFLDLDFVRQSKVLLVECTFFDREHVERARAGRHIHVDDLPKVCAAVPDAQVMLTHVTRRTDHRLNNRILQKVLRSEDIDRVSFLMERPPKPGAAQPAIPVGGEVLGGK